MNEKVYAALLDEKAFVRIKSAVYDASNKLLTFNAGFMRDSTSVAVPDGVKTFPYKPKFGRPSRVFLVDIANAQAVSVLVAGEIDPKLAMKINLLAQNKLWKYLGGRALDLIETLIYLAAGFGIGRMIEIVLVTLFGGK
jgi:hypothetical protein